MKAYKYEIKPTEEQKILLEKHFGSVRFLYNYGLQRKLEVYKKESKHLSLFTLTKEIVVLKEKYKWLNEINSQALQMSLRNLDNAFTSFFRKNVTI